MRILQRLKDTWRIHPYRQIEYSECGITCIRILAHYWGKKISMDYLRGIADISKTGISIGHLLDCCKMVGLEAKAAKIPFDSLKEMPLPAILFWDQSHFVVLYRYSPRKKKYYIADPSSGKMTFSEDDFHRHWSDNAGKGIVVLAAPADDFHDKDFPQESSSARGMWKMLKTTIGSNRGRIAAVLGLSFLILGFDICFPILFQRTIDDGISGRNISLVWTLIFSQLLIYLGSFTASSVMGVTSTKLGLKVGIEQVGRYLEKVVKLPMDYFDRKVSADLIQKVNDQDVLKNFFLSVPDLVFFTILNAVVFSVMLFYYSPMIFLLLLGVNIAGAGWTLIFKDRRKSVNYSLFREGSQNRNTLYEIINGMQEIKVNNAQQSSLALWRESQNEINRLTIRTAMIDLFIGYGTSLFQRLGDIAVTGICATFVIKGSMSLGAMMTISYIAGRLSTPLGKMLSAIKQYQDARIAHERLRDVTEMPEPEIKPPHSVPEESIELHDVGFKYPGASSPMVLKNISLRIPIGKTIAIVGPSGCGKTTLIKLLLGFYEPHTGHISADNITMQERDRDSWLKHCSAVLQNGTVFSGSILDNIALSDPCKDPVKAMDVLIKSCLDRFVKSLPMGIYTKIGSTGMELSGGQKQRLMIARALYKEPKILMLDEATSSLDANTEKEIVENLGDFSAGRTVIVAAHRLSTVQNADMIVYMDNGEIVESGTHKQLLDNKGAYWNLVRNQIAASVK